MKSIIRSQSSNGATIELWEWMSNFIFNNVTTVGSIGMCSVLYSSFGQLTFQEYESDQNSCVIHMNITIPYGNIKIYQVRLHNCNDIWNVTYIQMFSNFIKLTSLYNGLALFLG